MEMNIKERLLAAIRGQETDRVPWSPFLAYFWEEQSEEIRKRGQFQFLQDIGADPLLRGFYELFEKVFKNCNVIEKIKGDSKIQIYETPVGNLQLGYTYSHEAHSWFLMNHPLKTKEDYKIFNYINENMVIKPVYDEFMKAYKKVGNDGLILPCIGTFLKTSFQSLLEHWVGTVDLVYALMDYPEVVEETLEIMRVKSIETVKASINSPAEGFIFFEDSSTTNVSPSYYEKYIMPEINDWGKLIHENDKLLVQHACGHLKDLVPKFCMQHVDAIESISPPPTGNIHPWEMREGLPERISLIGGIEPTVFLNSSMEDLHNYVATLLNKMGKKGYVLANSDSCPPGVDIEKFKMISEMVKA